MDLEFKLLDVIALHKDLPDKNLCMGQVGTIVEMYDNKNFEVEFCKNKRRNNCFTPVEYKRCTAAASL